MASLPTYEQVATISMFQQKITIADEINYDINNHVLTLMACEGGLFQCIYKLNVVGSNEQVENYYIKTLRNSFPGKKLTFVHSK